MGNEAIRAAIKVGDESGAGIPAEAVLAELRGVVDAAGAGAEREEKLAWLRATLEASIAGGGAYSADEVRDHVDEVLRGLG